MYIQHLLLSKQKIALAILAAGLSTLPSISHAENVCESGIINMLQLTSGGTSTVGISTGGGDNYLTRRWIEGLYSTVIEIKDSDVRWRDRLSLLRTSFFLQQPIKIVANPGSDCIGQTDEFTIISCLPDKCK